MRFGRRGAVGICCGNGGTREMRDARMREMREFEGTEMGHEKRGKGEGKGKREVYVHWSVAS